VNEKPTLRRQFRAARRAIDSDTRSQHDRAIRDHLGAHETIAGAKVVAAYAAFDGEPDLAPLLATLSATGTTIVLPVVDSGLPPVMHFHEWKAGCAATPNRFGIDEPAVGQAWPLDAIDVVLLPLVAWDKAGGRLGMGAGYYDRVLAPYRDVPSPIRVGVGYDCQRAERVAMTTLDVPLHAMVSESGWFTCPAQHATMPPSHDPE